MNVTYPSVRRMYVLRRSMCPAAQRKRLNFGERRKHEVRSAPVRGARISPVVAPLRVATPCYPTEQRTLLGRGISTPKRCHHAALGRLEPSSAGRLLPRTSENTVFF